ncbi:MAG TPA: sulfate reduction electron transfer complex DsrMKJOP subunit DsrJ [Spirochaetota bacterium]|nr:sulfate reduction electron transfer complex DsrMKJOP subunit DsrJ [Spirochaetota bacterium]HQF07169.1 sulfate reduction electron transfer complex DsrMKJOP subunit DsrJ [Spirochaetota bacterium]HQH96068.1 sulfate reduction electron transfer complex DsrMKJOP subunit DsrJ [Spirochaetota bacterium]HQJ69246.1 sulfate reduction electron transfer complex DsrMKJOP subunit DsrJ [Spirochaetota bacterium]
MAGNRIVKTAAALALAAAIFGAPFWWSALRGMKQKAPAPEKPAAEKECVLPATEMRAGHMTLLFQWRDDAVRRGDRAPVAVGGKKYEKSLTGSCLTCHVKKENFCDRCHGSIASAPACFDCHIDTSERGPWK